MKQVSWRTLAAAALAAIPLAACGNTVTNNEVSDAVVGPPAGARVTVTHGSSTTTFNLEGALEAIGESWIGVRRDDGSVLWVPSDAVRSIEQHAAR